MSILHPNLKPTLLTLPLEIRLHIYKLLSQQTHRPPPGPGRQFSFPCMIAGAFNSAEAGYPRAWIPFLPVSSPIQILGTFGLVSKQVYHEIRGLGLVTYPELALEIYVDFSTGSESELVRILREALAKENLRENVVAVAIYFHCRKISCHHRTKVVMTIFDTVRSRLQSPPPAISKHEFHAAIQTIEQFPSLKLVHMVFNHGDLLEWFEQDVRGTLEVFESFLREGGVVSLGSQCTHIASQRCWPCNGLATALDIAGGSVVLEGTDNLKRMLVMRSK